MTTEIEFLLVAGFLYVWELVLWAPLRGLGLRRTRGKRPWKVLNPDSILVLRQRGALLSLPIIADTGMIIGSVFPLVAKKDGRCWLDRGDGQWTDIGQLDPARCELTPQGGRLNGISVPLMADEEMSGFLKELKSGDFSPFEAVERAWDRALSPARAKAAVRRWDIWSGPLRWYCPMLTLGFFLGLPLVFKLLGGLQAALLGAWLFSVLLVIVFHLGYVGGRVFPAAKKALWGEALLGVILPFHAMRAARHALAHAMGECHPAALLVAHGQSGHPWLAKEFRRVRHPRPGNEADLVYSQLLGPKLESLLQYAGKTPDDLVAPPLSGSDTGDAACFCPRCHSLYNSGATTCKDCSGLPLLPLNLDQPA